MSGFRFTRPLGNLVAYRCRKCGWDFTETNAAPSSITEVLEFWRCIDMRCDGRVEINTPRMCVRSEDDRNDKPRWFYFECGHVHSDGQRAVMENGGLTLTPRVGAVSQCKTCAEQEARGIVTPFTPAKRPGE